MSATMGANLIAAKRRYLKAENAKHSVEPKELPRESWPESVACLTLPPQRVWRAREYLAQQFVEPNGTRLTICTTEMLPSGRWRDGLTWDELQAIKRAIGFGDRWAVEIYPPEVQTVNVANMRHLWLLDSAPPYAWQRPAPPSGEVPSSVTSKNNDN